MALEGTEVAPLSVNSPILRRDPRPRRNLSQEVVHHEPAVPFALDEVEFLVRLRTARRGAAAAFWHDS